jgi:uroporphyrinogen-III synthase
MLTGLTIGITADRRWEEQALLFTRRNATVMHGATLRTMAPDSELPLRNATEAVIARPPDVVIANTGIGMRTWFAAADDMGLGPALNAALNQSKIVARGPKASAAVRSRSLDVFARCATERMLETIDLAMPLLGPGMVAAIQVDGSGQTAEIARLRTTGATILPIPVYEWRMPEDTTPALRLAQATIAGEVHAVTFTSRPAIGNWFAVAADQGLESALRDALNAAVVVGCVGPVCADAAITAGLTASRLIIPETYRVTPLVRAVTAALTGNDPLDDPDTV